MIQRLRNVRPMSCYDGLITNTRPQIAGNECCCEEKEQGHDIIRGRDRQCIKWGKKKKLKQSIPSKEAHNDGHRL